MQIVIDIDDDIYKSVVNNDAYVLGDVDWILLENAIANGTPLPKGHGRLIDADELKRELINEEWITDYDGDGLENIVDWQPTIIEADKESKSKELYTKVKDISENHYYKENNDNSYPGYLCNEDGSVCR